MISRRILIIAGIVLILFLGMYTWNQRTRALDTLASTVGLEVTGAVLASMRAVQDGVTAFWNRYFDLVNVREENEHLKARLKEMDAKILAVREAQEELKRLRALVQLPLDESWRSFAARVLSGRMGPNAALDSVTINRGYATGARPGTPLVTQQGLVGRVFRASPHTATALLVTDPASRIAVFTQQGRALGILFGQGAGKTLEVNFVRRDAKITRGEILITAGLDGKFPKGIPVGLVVNVSPSDYTQFISIEAKPIVDLQNLEEVLLLEATGLAHSVTEPDDPPPIFVGPPAPHAAAP
ncbi:MAG: rod shape-determining protein MreC [Candidatus Desulfovibrio kirbyi]|jgi:rod shape-determining protein MreC|uniref:Cell shape-determining protein MreC n=1 Tax=Candidatus Desulfovibrio kirbyi TaxID=2696086 RepID=A0A6L2R602_9BACT|nr:rod shape-determining protein MreC [Desulfovibrio sp.]GFH62998.1 MAG: rod shape-determining protein MreC [Candidatus Desulfovibrio kirbyi]